MLWKNPLIIWLASPGAQPRQQQQQHQQQQQELEQVTKKWSVETTIDDFHQWADDNKIFRSVEIYQESGVGGGKGLVATRDLNPGEAALHVPRALTIKSSGDVQNNDWAGNMASQLCDLQKEAAAEILGATVQVPFGEGQFYTYKPFTWKPYIEYGLPEEAPYTTCDWTDAELQQLQNETFVQETRATATWKESQFQRFASKHQKADFNRALALVCSRTLQSGPDSRMLVPFLDNANHASKRDGGGKFLLGSGSIVLYAGSKGAKKGEPVTLNYGERSSDEYAIHYGFVPEGCPGDTICIPELNNFVVSWDDCTSFEGHANPDVRRWCCEKLNAFPTSLADDQELLRTYNGGFDAFRVALTYRLSKKSLLIRAAGLDK